jgi:hypothetical protein
MFVTLKYDAPISDWEVVAANAVVEVLDIDYNGFVAVRHNGREFYLHSEYLELPALVSNY